MIKFLLPFLLIFSLEANELIGKPLPELTLEKDEGGRLDGSPWSLSEMVKKKKVTVIFYVDPDVKDKNEAISEMMSKRDFAKDKVQYIGVINMAATWLPNFAIAASLEKKQKKYPNTLYLKDYDKKAVKVWKVADDENNLLILDKSGKVIFAKFGALNEEERKVAMALIEKEKER